MSTEECPFEPGRSVPVHVPVASREPYASVFRELERNGCLIEPKGSGNFAVRKNGTGAMFYPFIKSPKAVRGPHVVVLEKDKSTWAESVMELFGRRIYASKKKPKKKKTDPPVSKKKPPYYLRDRARRFRGRAVKAGYTVTHHANWHLTLKMGGKPVINAYPAADKPTINAGKHADTVSLPADEEVWMMYVVRMHKSLPFESPRNEPPKIRALN